MIFRIFSCTVLILITASLYGQVNIDSLFDAAIAHSRQMEYEKALEDAGRVIGMDPKRTDVMLFMASVYAWQENYDDAKDWIERVFDIEPRTPGLYETWLNVLLWNGEYAKIFDVAGMAEVYGYTDHYNIALKKAIAYKELGQYSKGIEFLECNHELLDSAGLRYLYDELYLLSKRNHFEAYYSVDLFRGGVPTPQHLAYIGYGREEGRHTFILRGSYANRFEKHDFLGEIDYYHVLLNSHYLYGNYGKGASGELFPSHRAGIEYFIPLGKGFEGSIGGRYMNFVNTGVFIVTGKLAKYVSNSLIAVRPFYATREGLSSLSALASLRVYGDNPLKYWGVEIGYGNSPDDRFVTSQLEDILWLNAYRLKLEKNFPISLVNELKVRAGYSVEEYSRERYRQRFILELLLNHKF